MKLRVIFFLIFTNLLPIPGHTQTELYNVDYTNRDFSDLAFLKKELKDKSIVCLGEEWHGTETFNEVKNRIVKYLHQELGYHHLIFESSIYSPLVSQKNELVGKDRLLETLPTIWRTESVLDLIQYMDITSKSELEIKQYGIDMQGDYTGHFSNLLLDIFQFESKELLDKIARTEQLIQEEWIQKHRSFKKFKSKVTTDDINCYQDLIHRLNGIDIDDSTRKKLQWLLQNRIFLCKSLMNQEGKFYREHILASNLEWIISELVQGEKVIIWAADLHISKNQSKTYSGAEKSMIERLPEEYKKQIYSMSLIPVESLPKKIEKTLNEKSGRFYFYSTLGTNELSDKRSEFDGIIVCKQTESIKEYAVK